MSALRCQIEAHLNGECLARLPESSPWLPDTKGGNDCDWCPWHSDAYKPDRELPLPRYTASELSESSEARILKGGAGNQGGNKREVSTGLEKYYKTSKSKTQMKWEALCKEGGLGCEEAGEKGAAPAEPWFGVSARTDRRTPINSVVAPLTNGGNLPLRICITTGSLTASCLAA